jgi:hypothetical protein
VATPALATVTAAKEEVGGEDQQAAFKVVVEAFF